MSTVIEEAVVLETSEIETIAELLEKLGDLPPVRLPLGQSFGTSTEADVLRFLDLPRKRICELVDGTLVEKAMGYEESTVAAMLIRYLLNFIVPRKLGRISGEQGTLRLWPGRVRIPDVAFVSQARLIGHNFLNEPIPLLVPDLVVEVLSKTNTKKEMRLKREDYFQVGVRLVWEIDPETRTVQVFTKVDPPDATLTTADTLTGGEVLPDFTLSLREFFAALD